MTFSLILATRGRTKELVRLMDTLVSQSHRDFDLIVVDQNEDDRLASLVSAYSSVIPVRRLCVRPEGKASANNSGLAVATGDIVCFPDDDCWYPDDLLRQVEQRFVSHPDCAAVTGRESASGIEITNKRFDLDPGEVNLRNVWRRHISITMFFRRTALGDLRFDAGIGVGAGTKWGAGEDTDFLLRFMAQGHKVFYDPSIVVCHPDWGRGPLNEAYFHKSHSYAMSMGRILRIYRFPPQIVLKYLARPAGGMALSFLQRKPGTIRYYRAVLRGRFAGFTEAAPLPLAWLPGASLRPRIKAFTSDLLVRNAASLYGVQICRKLIPLVSVPYLARVLGPAGWGKVAFVQALGEGMVLVLEFGFNLSATREIARYRDSPGRCADVVAGTLGAQALLSIPAILGVIIAAHYVPMLRNQPSLLAAGALYGVAQGVAPLWFFQGLEKLTLASALEISSKLAGLAGLFIFVRHQGDEWMVLALQALAPAVSTAAALYLASRMTAFGMPRWCLVRQSLSQGWQMFLLRSSSSLYGVANSFVLGLLTTPSIVGYYACAEKIAKSISALMLPIRESLYPRISHLVSRSPDETRRLTRIGVILMGGGGLILGLLTAIGAPQIIHILMGPRFEPSIRVLQVLAALPFVMALTDSVGLQHLLPHGKESLVNPVMLAGGVFNLIAAFIFAPRFQAVGMAWCVLSAEILVCLTLMFIVIRSSRTGTTPQSDSQPEAEPAELARAVDV